MTTEELQQQRKRNNYIKQAYELICDQIDREVEEEHNGHLHALVRSNCLLLGDVTPSFYRDGEMHILGQINRMQRTINGKPYTKLNHALHPDLFASYTKIMGHYTDEKQRTKKAKDYLAVVLTRMPHLDNVLQLVPTHYTDKFNWHSTENYNTGEPLTYQELEQFKAEHREGEEAFMKLQLLEMLLS